MDLGYLVELKNFFTEHVDGYVFMPLYKSGQWDGTVSLFNKHNRTFPYGLLFEFIKFHKKHFPELSVSIEDEIKALFKGEDLDTVFDLKYEPRDYQLDCIKAAIKHKKNIFVISVGGGKCLSGVELDIEISGEDHKKHFPNYKSL